MAENNGELSDEDIIINDQDGLPNVHPNLIPEADVDSPANETDDEFDDLPTSLIVTNIHDSVFTTPDKKREFEDLFRVYDQDVTFQWLRSFRRLRVNFQTPLAAASARIQLHQYKINESVITCYFAQPVTPVKNSSLQPPAPFKQFLISPPASPPLDWEPRPEGEPIINHDLLAALATLTPGASHELHPPSPGQPSIVVHTALGVNNNNAKPRILHTSCPDRA
ncbi:calcipressin [Holotrichia oblita]|uniref:Calcipressin n=2 Tax=Holotrichia oblita TaxID=644536 RepID=A0ACB9SVB9_HOLOL|nr:calcipressin [Holotrichia oblita]KAI4458527.1 calcipressin [Holotrichia oblita]